MATTHHHFNYTSIPTTTEHINMLGLRDVVFIAPHQQPPPISSSDHHPNFHHLPSSAALGVGVSIFPLLTATPCSAVPPNASVDDCGNNDHNSSNFFAKKDGFGVVNNEDNDKGENFDGNSLRVCRDCGNRAKKECNFRRCRTCCKSRGYDCPTHVKSTWVPAAKRRERQMAMVGISFGNGGGNGSSGSSSAAHKRPRVDMSSQQQNGHNNGSSASNATTPRSFDISSCHQDASFKRSLPNQVRAPAVFRCIRVTAIRDSAAEFVYQATVTISGHVFKGFLYDQGIDEKNSFPCISKLRIEGGSGGRNRESSPIVDPSDAYAASGCRRLLQGDE